ncbi:MAG: hypothetical protein IH604_08245 [Burkholderiales bacterium]|nr:hypothetical protein [Burkholderiales bacterium]
MVLYLSMLVIPVQGYAASTMLHCGLAHQYAPAAKETTHALAHGHANHGHVVHQHPTHAALSADSIAYALSDEARNFTGGDHGPAKGEKPGVHDAGEHAACPAGAAVPASSLRFQPAESAMEAAAPDQFLNFGFVTDAPKRPPRSFFA